jgi:hypothetical protein
MEILRDLTQRFTSWHQNEGRMFDDVIAIPMLDDVKDHSTHKASKIKKNKKQKLADCPCPLSLSKGW